MTEQCKAIWVEGDVITLDCVKPLGHDTAPFEMHVSSTGQPWAGPVKEREPDIQWVSTSFKLPRDLLERLTKTADERVIGRNLLVRMALERFLNDLIPLDQLTTPRKEKQDEDDKAGYHNDSDGVFGRYLRGGVHTPTPKSVPQPSSSTSSVPGGVDGPDSEGFGVCLDLSCPSDGPAAGLPAEGGSGPDRRLDQPG